MKIPYLKLFLLALVISGTMISQAQNTNSGWMTEISIGPSFPVGKYKSKDYKDSTAGLAKTGVGISISLGYRLSDRIAILFLGGGAQNKQDEDAKTKSWNENARPGIRTEVHTNSWEIGKLMLGGSVQIPISKSGKFFSASKILAGISKTAIPAYSGIMYVNDAVNGQFSFGKISLPWTFSFQFNTGFNLQVSNKIYVLTDFNYFSSHPVYHTQKNYTQNPGGPFTPIDIKYSLTSFNVQAGAGLKF
jgi:hypothetical protein